jgi:hypothetical protein
VSNTVNQQVLRRYARPLPISTISQGIDEPFSFQNWYNIFQGIIPGQEYKQYNEYLVNWYKDKKQNFQDDKTILRLNYLSLLSQLQLFFTNQETENWYSKINLNDDRELLLAIPYFAKKLKDISIYYLQLRETIKQAQIKYKQTGTNFGLIVQLQNKILKEYTQNNSNTITLPANIWNHIPALTAINDSLNIQIESLYDTNTYFDRSPTVPVSSYYDTTNNQELFNFLNTKGLNTDSLNWIYNLGTYELTGLESNNLEYKDFIELSKNLSQKYLASNKYLTVQTPLSVQIDSFEKIITNGNNIFYWPTGSYKEQASQYKRYEKIPLSATNLATLGTAGSSLENADTIFIKTNQFIKGAWLQNIPYIETNENMQALIPAELETGFRYPFPGYGLSGNSIMWTGYGLSSDPRFFYLDKDSQQSILNEYWSQNTTPVSALPIKLNETTLIFNKAWPSKNYSQADKIKIWIDPPTYTTSVFSGVEKNAWLYRFDKTDISINKNSTTTILWPYQSITDNIYPNNYETSLTNICSPLAISAIDFSYAVAGNTLESADAIYKIKNINDTIEDATECCWLSGQTITNNKNTRVRQNNLQGIFKPGTFTSFIWDGPDFTNVNNVFKATQHRPDCKYINTPNVTYKDFKLCNCLHTVFSPFGHSGTKYFDNESLCDFIVEDNFYPEQFNLATWKDSDGINFNSSLNFFWYNTDQNYNFGYGKWVAGGQARNTNTFLRTNKRYLYFRANTRDLEQEDFPELVIRYTYNNFLNTYNINQKWINANKTENNIWFTTDTNSQMVINPGDLLLYSRQNNNTFYIAGTANVQVDIAENRETIWSNYNYVSLPTDPTDLTKAVYLSYPLPNTTTRQFSAQIPAAELFSTVVTVLSWIITGPNTRIVARNTNSTFFTPPSEGIYNVTVVAMSSLVLPPQTVTRLSTGVNAGVTFYYNNTALYTFNNIPPITAVPNIANVPTLSTINIPVPGYVLNTPLKGWDYSRSTFSNLTRQQDAGAKPFWGIAYNTKDSNTYYKGIDIWGQPRRVFDNYNVITQPEPSDIILTLGSKIRYNRKYNTNLTWNQPLLLQNFVNKKQWNEILLTTDTPTPTNSASTLVFENYIDNEPVEINYYALASFVWNITAQTIIPTITRESLSANQILQTTTPWANLPNQNFPTVNFIPDFNNFISESQLGGFFTPTKLGASVYVEQDFTNTFNITSVFDSLFDNAGNRRGLSKQDQITPFLTISNNIWLKEKSFSNAAAGNINTNIFKKYQKFYPYQSSYETNNGVQIGLVFPTSRQTPWTGPEDSDWGDSLNKPTTFTGELNLQNWIKTQRLKQTELLIDNWVTDIFGNQYGLYKNIRNVPAKNRKNITGELWVRKNTQEVGPASETLVDVFDTYKNTTLINDLTGSGIRKIDMFFDTLYIVTPGAIIFETINYDYVKDNIFSITDEARYISLALPIETTLNREFKNTDFSSFNFAIPGETWFLPEEKKILLPICISNNFNFEIILYEYNIVSKDLIKIFPLETNDINTIKELVPNLLITKADPPVISYNPNIKEIVIGVSCKDFGFNSVILEFNLKYLTQTNLQKINIYKITPTATVDTAPVVTTNLNRILSRPNPRGELFSFFTSYLTADSKILFEDLNDGTLTLVVAPTSNSQLIYPLSTLSLTSYEDVTFSLPLSNNYLLFELDPEFVLKYGDSSAAVVDPLDFTCDVAEFTKPAVFTAVDLPFWVSLSPEGEFTGKPPISSAAYSGTFKVTNDAGSAYYNLNINVV